jgi:hypothetical protein
VISEQSIRWLKEIKLTSDEETEEIAIECQMNYALLDENSKQTASGECKGTVSKEYLTIIPKFGTVLPFHLREIEALEGAGFKLTLPMFSRETLVLFNLGDCFEDFQRVLGNLRNEVIIKDLLMNETIIKPDVNTDFTYTDEKGNEKQRGPTRVRLYETGMVIIPQTGEFLRVPYGDIKDVSEGDYSVKIGTERGDRFLFQRMSSEYDSFVKQFSVIYGELQKKAISSLKALYPPIDSVSLRKAAAIMREGKAAKRADIEIVNPKLWMELEKRITSAGLNESYAFLKELGAPEKTAIGFKRGLMGDLTGEYIWFLIPIYGAPDKGYGNSIAMEAAEIAGKPKETEEEKTEGTNKTKGKEEKETTGKATYFFRMVGRREYPAVTNEQLDSNVDELIKVINRCLLDINFRREPIYLPDDRLDEADYVKYRIALRKIPSLKLLRDIFIGRVIHASPQQWKNDVWELLRFNVATQEDSAKWKKQ